MCSPASLQCIEGQIWKQSLAVLHIVQSRQASISKEVHPKGFVAFDTSEFLELQPTIMLPDMNSEHTNIGP